MSSVNQEINYWASIYASVACMVFVVVYSVLSPWWKTATGRLIMMLVFGLAGLASLSIIFDAYQDINFVRMIRALLVLLVGTAVWGNVISLIVIQRRKKDRTGRHRA